MAEAPLPIWEVRFDDGFVVNVVASSEEAAVEIALLAYPGSTVEAVSPEKL